MAAPEPVAASEAPAAESTESAAEAAEAAADTAPKVTRTTRSARSRSRAAKTTQAAPAAAETPEPVEAAAVPTPADEDELVEAEAEIETQVEAAEPIETSDATEDSGSDDEDSEDQTRTRTEDQNGDGSPSRRRRRRGGRRRRKAGDSQDDNAPSGAESPGAEAEEATPADAAESGSEGGAEAGDSAAGEEEGSSSGSRRRRRRRRSGDGGGGAEGSDDPENTVTRVRKSRTGEDQITALAGSTRLEAKKQRRREGREAGRRRAPIVSEAEFLARREAVDRVMVIRQKKDLTQIAVLEDKVLVEHYVARESQTSLIGNVYLGRVQNVLPSMEAAFIDIGKGRNAVLYAGEVNWSALGHKEGQPRKIESVLSSGQSVLVQVTKDPVGHKGARLTSQISLAGRFLVYVPDGTTSGISRKLPDTERNRLKTLLKDIVPDSAGVIVRTAAEGASEDELTRDVERLKARWEDIEAKARGNAPQLLYGEPDLTLKVVRDLFTEDFKKLVIEGDDAWDTVQGYVTHVAPDLEDRLERYQPADNASAQQGDVFAAYRIDEQIAKGLDRKVFLPSGGSLIIDRTEAMTVVDVNTGKFTGSGGNLEETVTKNNLEAAEEIVRQLRLRDIGGIIVVDFIDMVLESNRDLVVRRLVECLGRDRTRHQVAEVTSLGLVQMTRKRIGTGLLESFSTDCEHCAGRGVVVKNAPVEARASSGDDESRRGGRRGKGRGKESGNGGGAAGGTSERATERPAVAPSPKDVAAMAKPENAGVAVTDEPGSTPAQPEVQESTTEAAPAQSEVAQPEVAQPEVAQPRSRSPRSSDRRSSSARSRDAGSSGPGRSSPRSSSRGPSRRPSPPAASRTPSWHPSPLRRPTSRLRVWSPVPAAGPPRGPPAPRRRPRPRPWLAADATEASGTPGASPEGEDGANDSQVEHVPVKKKGARKR